jgi:hypothetical protein
MNAKGSRALLVAVIGFGWVFVSSPASADGNTALRYAELRQACAEQGGRFERSWRYNDQGMQWGEVLTCSTGTGYVACQDDVCRSGRWGRAEDPANKTAARFPVEPATVAGVLAALAGK